MKREILFTISFFILLLIANSGFSQTSISGVVNFYSAVDSIYPSKDTIEVTNPSVFSANDTVMIYQAKGAEARTITAAQPFNFGVVLSANNAGQYEIILVKKVSADTVFFSVPLRFSYDVEDSVQLVKVPSYKNVSVDGELTCDAWDGEKGGILALMVSDTLFLNANIDVTGKGFRGAEPFLYDSTSYGNNCAFKDSALYSSLYFEESNDNASAGFKGEGVSKTSSVYRKGIGRWANGGGGGNARFSGGGGGGNYGNGGYGGEEDTATCSYTPAYEDNPDYFYDGSSQWNSLGGFDGGSITNSIEEDTIFFLGGGGGSGTYTDISRKATRGGNGGGIVVLIAKNVKGNSNAIIADGESVTEVAIASGGGGGAGGSIVFDVDSIHGTVDFSVKGGSGGLVKTDGIAGPGGGGGGGVLIVKNPIPFSLTEQIFLGGSKGFVEEYLPYVFESRKARNGTKGGLNINRKIRLTGFLFNNISSDQEVCMNSVPELISGSEPRGGNGTYTYQWQESPDGEVSSWTNITDANSRDFQPPILSDTIFYRRVVTSGTITDYGNSVEIIIQNNIVNNQIFGDDTVICIGNEADTITGTSAIVTGGNYSDYNYTWQYSFDEQSWTTDNALNDTTYLHGTVSDTTLVRRIVQSGACYDTTSYVEIVGLPQISNNVLSDDQEICYGQIPDVIIGEVHEGGLGLGTDSINWQKKTESGSWEYIDSTRKDLAPSNLVETMYYRRVIISDDCEDFSDPHKVNVLPLITDDTITTEPVIYTCYGTPPQQIIASEPTGGAGAGSYSYQWQKSADAISWTDISSNATSKDYQPVALTDTTYFRRKVFSGLDDCCSSISDTVRVNIYVLPVATIQNLEDSVCSGEEKTLDIDITEGKIPYIITYNDGFNDFTSNPINDTQYNPLVSPETTSESEIYDYTVIAVTDDNGCEATDMTGLTKIHVYGNPVADAGSSPDENCELSYQLSATPTLGTGYWSQVSTLGNSTFDDVNASNAIVTVDTAAQYKFEWKEINWQCEDQDTVDVDFYERPYNIYVNPQDTILYFVDSVTLKGSYINPDQYELTSLWEMLLGGGNFSETENSLETTLTDLNDQGQNQISVTWTISKRECEDTTVNVSIRLQELFTPTGFTPNGDGVNDYLKFNGIENSDEKQLIIYNRWGTEVYNKKGAEVEMGWDGKNEDEKDLPEDTYYYILIVTDDGVAQTHKGFIVLKRY
ncbi:MAG: gliding motility-associated C-terminal domain-containing protein [Bacteroidetes bacterium]|nr:gliding motility-associated C-terminal domain-containing protein [Bacteroidota bacterium]